MGIYHLSVKYVSRNQGRSAIAAAAYRSGERLYDRYYGIFQDYSCRTDVVHKEIILPINAPERFYNRQVLWNEAEFAEKRIDSRVAREVEIAVPNEKEFSLEGISELGSVHTNE